MSETATEKRPRAVNYDLIDVGDELPGEETRAGRVNEHSRLLDKIQADPQKHGRWFRIGAYRDPGGAVSRRNKLVNEHGQDASINGWEFATRKISERHEETGDELTRGVFAKYTPDEKVPGAIEQWREFVQNRDDERQEKARSKKAAKEAKAKSENGNKAQPKQPVRS